MGKLPRQIIVRCLGCFVSKLAYRSLRVEASVGALSFLPLATVQRTDGGVSGRSRSSQEGVGAASFDEMTRPGVHAVRTKSSLRSSEQMVQSNDPRVRSARGQRAAREIDRARFP
ncbi:hypothetical protein MTO96_008922 [Rhipicephalus appendiculatus]